MPGPILGKVWEGLFDPMSLLVAKKKSIQYMAWIGMELFLATQRDGGNNGRHVILNMGMD